MTRKMKFKGTLLILKMLMVLVNKLKGKKKEGKQFLYLLIKGK